MPQPVAETCELNKSNRLCVTDTKSCLRFLIDTGANVSVLQKTRKLCDSENCDYKLYAANGTEIKTYGVKTLNLDFGLRRQFRWTFIIADVKQNIIGADFLSRYGLLVDISARKLIDKVTSLDIIASVINICDSDNAVKTVDNNHPYYDMLSTFPDLTKPR